MATTEGLAADEATRRSLSEGFAETPPVRPVAGCGPTRALELGCFFDGTGNNRWLLPEGYALTNVVHLHDAYPTGRSADGSAERHRHYLIGVGAGAGQGSDQPTQGTDWRGGAQGVGSKQRVNLMYQWVKQKIEDHARACSPESLKLIDVFGFSRGAMAARTFVNLVNQALKLEPGPAFRHIEVRFLGVFDTVERTVPSEAQNCHLESADHRAARHFTARHEIRMQFPLTIHRAARSIAYPGDHCDVGGGWVDGADDKSNWLSFVTLFDMREAGRSVGIEMGEVPIPDGCDVSPTSPLRTSSDADLEERYIHDNSGGIGVNARALPDENGDVRRGIVTTAKATMVGHPPEFGWNRTRAQ